MLLLETPARAQRIELHARAGVVLSTALVEDRVGTMTISQQFGITVDSLVRVVPAPGLNFGLDVRTAFWPRATLDAAVDWTWANLLAQEDGRERTVQSLHVVQATVGASWRPRPRLELGAAVGLMRYVTAEQGLFERGSDVSPLAEAHVAVSTARFGNRLALRLHAQTHRFGTPAIRERGGSDGSVQRLGAALRVRLGTANP